MRAVACVLLVACGGDGLHSPDASQNQTALQYCVQETNRYRMTVPAPGTGAPRPALTESSGLEAYAATGAMYDFTNGPHAHFMSNGGGGIAFAENECPANGGWMLADGADPKPVIAMCIQAFNNGGPAEGHYENMISTSYKSLGCGFYANGGRVAIIQDFGN